MQATSKHEARPVKAKASEVKARFWHLNRERDIVFERLSDKYQCDLVAEVLSKSTPQEVKEYAQIQRELDDFPSYLERNQFFKCDNCHNIKALKNRCTNRSCIDCNKTAIAEAILGNEKHDDYKPIVHMLGYSMGIDGRIYDQRENELKAIRARNAYSRKHIARLTSA